MTETILQSDLCRTILCSRSVQMNRGLLRWCSREKRLGSVIAEYETGLSCRRLGLATLAFFRAKMCTASTSQYYQALSPYAVYIFIRPLF